ncbi:hypothetical protein BDZ94DRAFT_1284675 [Collybia nuda]|uniref:Uncharacterized protein n=1 Tax=Collybia nuda TaxID=64659 RepID=A0A9P6CAT5_9AGAR|nr:hypothetical protein BDZ94DRAFT_1284675 [Collybia nuda]
MVQEWRHLTLLKRSGRGHSPTGVEGTKQGECAALCPACPQPGRNLPIGWENAPEHKRWLYTLFLGIDANFHLKRLAVSNDVHDPGLNHRFVYIVEEQAFKSHLKEFDTQIPPEPSTTCNNYDAPNGAGTIDCSQHDMKRPVSVGDLQLGERYINMDYIFLLSLRQNAPHSIVTSYDIACQWTRNLHKRCEIYETDIDSSSILFLIPKFHLPAH